MKIDVWDFGAAALDDNQYNNQLTIDIINRKLYEKLYKEVEGAQLGENLTSFQVGDLEFWTDRKDNRLRAKNDNLTRFDDNADVPENVFFDETIKGCLYLQDSDGRGGQGILYMNLEEGDKLTIYMRFDREDDDLVFWLDGIEEARFPVNMQGGIVTFVAKETGRYMFTNGNDVGKLKVYRILRERAQWKCVRGTVTVDSESACKEIPEDMRIALVHGGNGKAYSGEIGNGKFQVRVPAYLEQAEYGVRIIGAATWVVESEVSIKINGDSQEQIVVIVKKVPVHEVCGRILGLDNLSEQDYANVVLELKAVRESRYEPTMEFQEDKTYVFLGEDGMSYKLQVEGCPDYICTNGEIKESVDITFAEKERYVVTLQYEGLTKEESAQAEVIYTNVDEGCQYQFMDGEEMKLRAGRYAVKVKLSDMEMTTKKKQRLTSYLNITDQSVCKVVSFQKIRKTQIHQYQELLCVGAEAQFQTIHSAVEYAQSMKREVGQRVVIEIEPGNYEEMLVIKGDDITLRNASANPSTALKYNGVDINEEAVRITSYYGHGCRYYSMGADGRWDEEVLQVQKENGMITPEVVGNLSSVKTYWNATVVIQGEGFMAEGIIFENSFNQYVSKKEAEDVIELSSDNRGGQRPKTAGNVAVQNFEYLERAAALAMTYSAQTVHFHNCRFVGRQDTLYGDFGVKATFDQCEIMGSIDYIFGGMAAVFTQCGLIMNTSDDREDIAYITAPQTKAGEAGFLMIQCEIRSAYPGMENASLAGAHPGYFGRPWALGTAQAIFVGTKIHRTAEGVPIIAPEGWSDSLSGESSHCYEWDSKIEKIGHDGYDDFNNCNGRVVWARNLPEEFKKIVSEKGLDL